MRRCASRVRIDRCRWCCARRRSSGARMPAWKLGAPSCRLLEAKRVAGSRSRPRGEMGEVQRRGRAAERPRLQAEGPVRPRQPPVGMPRRYRVPIQIMGLTNLAYGFYGRVVALAISRFWRLLGSRGSHCGTNRSCLFPPVSGPSSSALSSTCASLAAGMRLPSHASPRSPSS